MDNEKIIGIIGGVGPYAGADLCRKIFDLTQSTTDQDHISIILLSMPNKIVDRTKFILGETTTNPAYAIIELIRKIEQMGACIVGIPCNSCHTPEIFEIICENLEKTNSHVKLINMIEEVGEFIKMHHKNVKNVGILSSNGTYKSSVYEHILRKKGFNVIMPCEDIQYNVIHNSIYDSDYGIKAKSNPVTYTARNQLLKGINYLIERNAQAVVLGCTEMPLAIFEKQIGESIIIDSTFVLARALVYEAAPHKLKFEYDKSI